MTNSWSLISNRNQTDKAECNPSLICMEKSLRLIFNIQWYNTKNPSSQTNDKTGNCRDFLRCSFFFFSSSCSLLKISTKPATTVTDVNYKLFKLNSIILNVGYKNDLNYDYNYSYGIIRYNVTNISFLLKWHINYFLQWKTVPLFLPLLMKCTRLPNSWRQI